MRFGAVQAIVTLAFLFANSPTNANDSPRLLRSLSGPSGTVSGATFVFDSIRSRFVYPQDKSLTIFFEWDTPPGHHVLTGIWKQPDGRTATISPDVKIDTPTNLLTCYWIFNLTPGLQNGFWTLEVRIDGQTSGSHPFEIAGMEEPKRTPEAAPAPPKMPTLDEVFQASSPSLVWIHKLDKAGRRSDTSSGFILERDRVATSFRAVDAAASLELEFADGHKVPVSRLRAWSRPGDWAILDAATGSAPPLPRGDPRAIAVGERLIVFNFESGSRIMGGVDIGARGTAGGSGDRVQISPAISAEAAGGPLLDLSGRVVGILGGTPNSATTSTAHTTTVNGVLLGSFNITNAATPISDLPRNLPLEAKTFEALLVEAVLTAPVQPMVEFVDAGATNQMPKPGAPLPHDVSDFSNRDPQIWVYALLAKKGKRSKGDVSLVVFDSANRQRVVSRPKKVTLGEATERLVISFSPAMLQPGIYRVDLNWDGEPAWRTFIRVTE